LNNLGAAACALGEHHEAAKHLHEALQIAFEIGATPLVLEVLAEIGALLAASETGNKDQAITALAFVLNHSLTDHWTREKAERTLAELAPDLSPAARETGPAAELEEIVAEVLSKRDAWLNRANEHQAVFDSVQ
jgi:hypothetical protein